MERAEGPLPVWQRLLSLGHALPWGPERCPTRAEHRPGPPSQGHRGQGWGQAWERRRVKHLLYNVH